VNKVSHRNTRAESPRLGVKNLWIELEIEED
jgi:hypothetical protein